MIMLVFCLAFIVSLTLLAAVVAYHAIVLAVLIARLAAVAALAQKVWRAVSSPVPANVNRASRAGPQALHDQSGAFDQGAVVHGSTGGSGRPLRRAPHTCSEAEQETIAETAETVG
jgi:hypothetical protein